MTAPKPTAHEVEHDAFAASIESIGADTGRAVWHGKP